MTYILSSLLIFLWSIGTPFTLGTEEIISEKSTTINSYDEDITGDGFKESIELKGVLLSNNSNYYRDIWVDIKNPQTKKQWKVSYGGGYDPSLQFIDLNQDKTTDMFAQIAHAGESNTYTYHIHSLNKEHINRISLPKQSYINGNFKDDFTIHLNIEYDAEPVIIDIGHKQEEYIQHGIYNQDGTLTKPTPVIIDPISQIEPLLISRDKGFGLRTVQEIRGSSNHKLGSVQSLWYFEMGKWLILRTKWVPL